MAQNFVQKGHSIEAVVTDPASPKSGDPVAVGAIPGVALNDEDAAGLTVLATKGVFNLPVHGHNGTTPGAIGLGARVYLDAGTLNANTSGVLFGKTLGAVESDALTTIPVMLIQA